MWQLCVEDSNDADEVARIMMEKSVMNLRNVVFVGVIFQLPSGDVKTMSKQKMLKE